MPHTAFAIKVWLELIHTFELLDLARVWRIADLQQTLHPAGCSGIGAAMSEGVEGRFTSISTGARGTDTTKGKGRN